MTKSQKLMLEDRYLECPACGKVLYDKGYKLIRLDELAPCCGASGKSRGLWPSSEVLKFLEIVASQDLDSSDERPTAIVFLCTAVELLLERVLWNLLDLHTRSERLSDFVLDGNWGRERRIRLYNKLSDRSLGELLKARNASAFLENWKKLSKLRNQVVHGRYYTGGPKETDLIRSVHKDCLKVFADVHNDVQRMIDQAAGQAKAVSK